MLIPDGGQYVEVDGLRTFYIKSGNGHPLLFLHGGSPGACSLVSWKRNISYFAGAGFLVYAFDQPGYGLTDNPDDFSMEYRICHAKAFIDKVRLRNFFLVGNSHGGYVAAKIAMEDQRTKALVLVSPSGAPLGSSHSEELAKQHSAVLRDYEPSLENVRALTRGTLYDAALVDDIVGERYEMSVGKNYDAQLSRKNTPPPKPFGKDLEQIKCRTLILWGNNDKGSSTERAFLLFKLLPNSELHVFDRCAHWPQWDQTDSFNRVVADFLRSTSTVKISAGVIPQLTVGRGK